MLDAAERERGTAQGLRNTRRACRSLGMDAQGTRVVLRFLRYVDENGAKEQR